MGTQLPPHELLLPNGWMDQDAAWYRGRHRPRRLCVRCGPRCPQKGGRASHFLAYVYCGQTARCIKMPLGRAIGLGSGDIIFDGDRAPPPKKGAQPPIFGPYLSWPNGRPSQLLLSCCCLLVLCVQLLCMVVCLELGACDLAVVKLMPLPPHHL